MPSNKNISNIIDMNSKTQLDEFQLKSKKCPQHITFSSRVPLSPPTGLAQVNGTDTSLPGKTFLIFLLVQNVPKSISLLRI